MNLEGTTELLTSTTVRDLLTFSPAIPWSMSAVESMDSVVGLSFVTITTGVTDVHIDFHQCFPYTISYRIQSI